MSPTFGAEKADLVSAKHLLSRARIALVLFMLAHSGSTLPGFAADRVVPIDRDRVFVDSNASLVGLRRCICPRPSERNLLGLERPEPHALGKRPVGASQTILRVLGIRVEFPYEETDDLLTTGRGRFDLRDTLVFFDSAGHNFDTSPHNRRYFQTHLRALNQYWSVVSNEHLSLEWDVFPVSEDSAFRVPAPMAYYGQERPGDSGLVFGLREFIRDAAGAASLDPAIRFADYDAVIFFHAGTSRQYDVLNDTPHDLFSAFLRRDEPVILRGGADTLIEAIIIPETVSQDGRISVLNGLLAHEFGHQLGLVDLYSTFNFATQVGNFSLMDNNANDVGVETVVNDQTRILFGAVPVFPDAWSRAYLGFVDVRSETDFSLVSIAAAEGPEPSPDIEPPTRQVWRVPISSTEYYLLENRQFDLDGNRESGLKLDSATNVVLGPAHPGTREFTNEYDFLLPGSGMLIWHVDEGVASLDYATGDELENNFLANTLQWDHNRRFLRIVEADGYTRLGSDLYFFYTGGPTTYWLAGNNANFTPNTVPPSRSYTGGFSGVGITNISASSLTMSCRLTSSGRLSGFPVYVGTDHGNRAAPTVTDVVRSVSGDYRFPGDGSPEVLVGYKHYILAFDSEGNSLTNHPVEDTLRSFDTTDVIRTLYPVAMGIPGESWMSAPLIMNINSQTTTIAAVSDRGNVGIWTMYDGDLDGLFDPVVDTGIVTSSLPSGPPVIWDRVNTSSIKDLFVPVGDSGYETFSLLDGTRSHFSSGGIIGDVAGRGPSEAFSIDSADGLWRAGVFGGFLPPVRLSLGNVRPFAPAIADLDRNNIPDGAVLTREGMLHAIQFYSADDTPKQLEGFPIDIGFRPTADPIIADIDRDGYPEIIVAGGGRIVAYAHNGVIANDFPVTIGRRDNPDTTAPGLLALDFGGDPLSILSGGMSRATLAYQQGSEVQAANYAVGGDITAPMAFARNTLINQSVIYSRASDGYLYGFLAPNPSASPSSATWAMVGHDARNTRALPTSDLGPVNPEDIFFVSERAYVYPNPANGEAVIRYWLGEDATASIKIFDLAGELVEEADGPGTGGVYNEWTWTCADVASGVYYVRLEVTARSGGQSETVFCKMAVLQ